MNEATAAKIAALIAALSAITIEDLQEIKNDGNLGPDVAQNISDLQNKTASIDDETLSVWGQGRKDAGLSQV